MGAIEIPFVIIIIPFQLLLKAMNEDNPTLTYVSLPPHLSLAIRFLLLLPNEGETTLNHHRLLTLASLHLLLLLILLTEGNATLNHPSLQTLASRLLSCFCCYYVMKAMPLQAFTLSSQLQRHDCFRAFAASNEVPNTDTPNLNKKHQTLS